MASSSADGYLFVTATVCPGGTVITPEDFTGAYEAALAVEAADEAWAADLDNPGLKAAYKAARKHLREQNQLARGRPWPCWKCSSQTPGRIPAFGHILGGVCFACEGLGWRPFSGLAVASAPDLRARKAAARAAEQAAAHARGLAFAFQSSPLALAGLVKLGASGMPKHQRAHRDVQRALQEGGFESAADFVRAVAYGFSEDPGWYSLRARRSGRCAACKERLSVGETICWDAEHYLAWHERCAPVPARFLPPAASDQQCVALLTSVLGPHWPDDLVRAGLINATEAKRL